MADSPYKPLAEQTRELYWEFRDAGFTEEQAFELVKSQYSFVIVNAITDSQKTKDWREARRIIRENTKKVDVTCQE